MIWKALRGVGFDPESSVLVFGQPGAFITRNFSQSPFHKVDVLWDHNISPIARYS